MSSIEAQVFQALLSGIRFAGVTLSFGKVYFYYPGTTTLKTVYRDRGKTQPVTTFITLDVDGMAPVYGDGVYDVKITSATDAQKAYWYNVALVDVFTSDDSIDVRDYGDDLAAAVTDIGTAGKTILVRSAVTCDTLTVPVDRCVRVEFGGSINSTGALTFDGPLINLGGSINNTGMLTINGPFSAGLYPVFTGSGTVVFGPGSIPAISPEWGGSGSAGVQWAVGTSAASDWLPIAVSQQYTITTPINIDRFVDTMTGELRFIGIGPKAGFYTADAITMFTSTIATTNMPLSERVTFENIRWEAASNTLDAFCVDGSKFLRMKFINNFWSSIRCAKSATYLQSWRFSGGHINLLKGKFLQVITGGLVEGLVSDMHVTDLSMEHSDRSESVFLNNITGDISGSDFKGNLFENSTGPFIETGGLIGSSISGNYFEDINNCVFRLGSTVTLDLSGNEFISVGFDDPNSPDYAVDCQLAVNITGGGNRCTTKLYNQINMPAGISALSTRGDFATTSVYNGLEADVFAGTGHLTGLTTDVAMSIKARKEGALVTLTWADASGTSNTTDMTLTGVPQALLPISGTQNVSVIVYNNGVVGTGLVSISSTGIQFYSGFGDASFTASGTKGLRTMSITYSLYP